MVLIDPVLGAKLVFLLGITNIVSLVFVLLSCRCNFGWFVKRFWEHGWMKRFYNLHCYFWWVFIISVVLHTVLAFISFGSPF